MHVRLNESMFYHVYACCHHDHAYLTCLNRVVELNSQNLRHFVPWQNGQFSFDVHAYIYP